MDLLNIFLVVLLLIIVMFIGMGFFISNKVLYHTKRSHEYARKEQEDGGVDMAWFDGLEREEVFIESPFGYKLYGLYFPIKDAKKTVIICHGHTYNLYGSVMYMQMFRKRNFNILIYDHRNHGKSGGKVTTLGYYEKIDLKACTDWVKKKCGNDMVVGTVGQSMGAVTALLNTVIDKRVAFCIADCPYSDVLELLKLEMRHDYHLPVFPVIYICRFFSWLRAGIRLTTLSPIKFMDKITIPLFLTHGQDDKGIPKEMSIDMYEKKKGLKRLFIAPNADHGEAYEKNPEEYDRLVGEFLKEFGIYTEVG